MDEEKINKDMTKKTRIVIASEEILDGLPDEVKLELEEIMKKLASGEVLGEPCDFTKCDIQLLCPRCGCSNVIWMLEKNSQEVTFNCYNCGEKFWMTVEEYKLATEKNPECIIGETKWKMK